MAQKLTPRRAVMRYLWSRTTSASAKEIAAKVGLDARQVGSVLRPLVEQGLVLWEHGSEPKLYFVNGGSTYRDAR